MKKFVAEMIGTFILVLFGCGTAVVAGGLVGVLGIALAFGLALIAAAYGIGPISGCHINPAVTLGAFAAGRIKADDLPSYIAGQCLGAILAAGVLLFIVRGLPGGYDASVAGLGQNGWGVGYMGQFNMLAAGAFEVIATFIFLVVILGSTQKGAPDQLAGLAIGLTLAVIHIFGINITGVSVNPARSLGPAVFVGGKALEQLWLFLLAPTAGAIAAGLLFRYKLLEK